MEELKGQVEKFNFVTYNFASHALQGFHGDLEGRVRS